PTGPRARPGTWRSRLAVHAGHPGRAGRPAVSPRLCRRRDRSVHSRPRSTVMQLTLADFVFAAGIGQLTVLVASALVPSRLKWRDQFRSLSPLHAQLYWVYGGYTLMSIIALGLISAVNSREIADGTLLARSFALYAAIFWSIRLALQAVLDV